MIAFCREVWSEVAGASIVRSKAMLCSASDQYLESAFDCFAPVGGDGCSLFQDGVCGVAFEVVGGCSAIESIIGTYSQDALCGAAPPLGAFDSSFG